MIKSINGNCHGKRLELKIVVILGLLNVPQWLKNSK